MRLSWTAGKNEIPWRKQQRKEKIGTVFKILQEQKNISQVNVTFIVSVYKNTSTQNEIYNKDILVFNKATSWNKHQHAN